jgi:hypothetical protein
MRAGAPACCMPACGCTATHMHTRPMYPRQQGHAHAGNRKLGAGGQPAAQLHAAGGPFDRHAAATISQKCAFRASASLLSQVRGSIP